VFACSEDGLRIFVSGLPFGIALESDRDSGGKFVGIKIRLLRRLLTLAKTSEPAEHGLRRQSLELLSGQERQLTRHDSSVAEPRLWRRFVGKRHFRFSSDATVRGEPA
jgi:hypothetical protein